MKTVAKLVALTATLLASSAFADTYTLPEGVVARLVTAGFFHPVEMPDASGIDIKADGQAISFKEYGDGHRTEQALATLTAERLTALTNNTKDLASGVDLVKADPDAVGCMDAPSSTYLARNAQGDVVALKGYFACLSYYRADQGYSQVSDVLDGLQALAYLQ